jgi:DNA-directed RNA polymerase subunit RPC12/RpoP
MTTQKKLLIVFLVLLAIAAISATAGFAGAVLFGLHYWGVFALTALVQFIIPLAAERYTFSKKIQEAVKEYANKPFRKYEIPLTCQYCGHSETVDVDLNNTVYKCSTCDRKNAVYVSFMTAIIQNEQS